MEDIVLIYTVTLDPSESVVGKGINISLVLKKLGIESIATGIVNHKNVEQVAEELDKAEIENQFIEQKRGIKITAKNQQKLLDYLKVLKAGDILVIAGGFAKGIDPVYLTGLAKVADKKAAGLVVDVPYENVLDILPMNPLLIKPNETELKHWFEKDNQKVTTKELINMAHDLVVKGAQHVLLSLGANGAAIVNMMDALMAHAPEIEEVVDSTGSGDALLGTFLAGMLKGYMPVKNLSDAIAAGSDTARSDWLTDFRTTPALQKQVIARRITFEEAE